MNTALLAQWLQLPPGPWPPEPRAILGIADGSVDASLAESNALARMEMLRPHQLKHPEIVTEGMNRLAQALIALTSSAAPAEATVSLRKPQPKRASKPKPALVDSPFPVVDLAPVDGRKGVASQPAPDAPRVLEAEVIAESEAPEVLSAAPVAIALSVPLPPAGLVLLPEIADASDRRKSYRQLAYLRRLFRTWISLQPVLAVPSEPITSAEAVYRVLVGSVELRAHLRRGRARYHALDAAGGSVLALAAQPQAVLVLREMIPGQRQAIAIDWATAKASLEAQLKAVRKSLARPKSRDALADALNHFRDSLRQNPEWVLGVLTFLVLICGLGRTILRSSVTSP